MPNRVTKTDLVDTCRILSRMLGMSGLYIAKDSTGYKLEDMETGREYSHRLDASTMREALLGMITGVELANNVLHNARRTAFARECGIPITAVHEFVTLGNRVGTYETIHCNRPMTPLEQKTLENAWIELRTLAEELSMEHNVNLSIDSAGLYPHVIANGRTVYIPYDERE